MTDYYLRVDLFLQIYFWLLWTQDSKHKHKKEKKKKDKKGKKEKKHKVKVKSDKVSSNNGWW